MNKNLLELAFSRITRQNFTVHYWDGTVSSYGAGMPDFHIIFHRELAPTSERDISIVLGEAYMRGDLDFDGSFDAMAKAMTESEEGDYGVRRFAWNLLNRASNLMPSQNGSQQQKNVQAHYDLGNDFFSLWLDKDMSYSCAYFKEPEDSLEAAQEQKLDLVLKKLDLRPGMHLLDIGCGWGALALKAVREYGVKVTAITLSREQFSAATRKVRQAGLEESIAVRLQNYLDLEEKEYFERIVSVGMFEHVGQEHIPRYFAAMRDLLVPGGVSLLHCLTKQVEVATNAWIRKHIFPGGYIPALREIMNALPETDMHALHIESLRRHYAKTLEIWHERFSKPEVREKVRAMFDEPFERMWSLYLRMSAAFLRTGGLDVHQIVFSKGVNNGMPMTLRGVYCE